MTFSTKNTKILNSLTVPKNVKGTLWAFSTSIRLQNIKKLKGRPFGDIKKTRKTFHKAEKRGGKSLIVPKKLERGILCTTFPLAGLGLSSFSSLCRKWTFQCEVCGLENKPGTAQVGAISKAQKQQKDFKVSKYSLLRYRKNPKVEPNWRTRGDTLRFFIHSVANQKKLMEGHFW